MDLEDIVREKEYWEDDFDEDRILFADDKKRGTMLIWNDFLILTVEYIQWLMLVSNSFAIISRAPLVQRLLIKLILPYFV